MAETKFAETSSLGSEFQSFKPVREVEIKVVDLAPEHLQLHVGTVKVSLNARGFGTVEVDGKAMNARALTVKARVGEPPVVRLEIYAN